MIHHNYMSFSNTDLLPDKDIVINGFEKRVSVRRHSFYRRKSKKISQIPFPLLIPAPFFSSGSQSIAFLI